MQFCHFCGMQGLAAEFRFSQLSGPLFISIASFTAGMQNWTPLPAPAAPKAPVTATSRGTARPSSPPPPACPSRRRPRPALAVVAVARCRRCCSLSSRPSARCRRRPSRWRHVPRARRRRCCGPLLRRGRPRRWRPPRPRLRRHCKRRNFTAGNLPKAYQIMRNDAKWKMNLYHCTESAA